MVEQKDMCSSSPRGTQKGNYYQQKLKNHQQENIGSHQKKIPHAQGERRAPNKMVEGVKSYLDSNLMLARDTQRQTKPCTRTRDPTRD